jgi:Domain of unknown function (DUF4406)
MSHDKAKYTRRLQHLQQKTGMEADNTGKLFSADELDLLLNLWFEGAAESDYLEALGRNPESPLRQIRYVMSNCDHGHRTNYRMGPKRIRRFGWPWNEYDLTAYRMTLSYKAREFGGDDVGQIAEGMARRVDEILILRKIIDELPTPGLIGDGFCAVPTEHRPNETAEQRYQRRLKKIDELIVFVQGGREAVKVYIAGPMRGIAEWNYPAFDEAEARWRAAGHIAFSPARTDRALGYDSNTGISDGHLRHVILADIVALFHADAIALLPGWEHSSGVAVELALAQFLGLPVYDAETMLTITPSTKPWGRL